MYAGVKLTVTVVPDGTAETVPSVLVVLPLVPVTNTVAFTANILDDVTVKVTDEAPDGLPLVVAPVCFKASYCA